MSLKKNGLRENISELNKIHRFIIIIAKSIGNNTFQQSDIHWSNLFVYKDALAQIKINIIIQDFTPNITPLIIPSINGSNIILSFSAIKKDRFSEVNGLDNEIFSTGSNKMKKE